MNRTISTISVIALLMGCSMNESENIILPRLVSAKVSQVQANTYEIVGKFIEGQYPIKDVKLALGTNTSPDLNPKSFYLSKSVDELEKNSFRVEFTTNPDYYYHIAFYFIGEKSATYSESYGLSNGNDKITLVQIYPDKN